MTLNISDDCYCLLAGEQGFILYFKGNNLLQKNQKVQIACCLIKAQDFDWLMELVPSYDSLLLEYDLLNYDHHYVIAQLKTLLVSLDERANIASKKSVTLPVWYGERIADSDLQEVAHRLDVSVPELIDIHISCEYRVYAVGFQPGFAYSGELDERLALPRRSKPRLKVPKGAVAIADKQTAIYPNESPGGWHILGLCPIDMTALAASDNALKIGDILKFESVDEDQYNTLLSNNSQDAVKCES